MNSARAEDKKFVEMQTVPINKISIERKPTDGLKQRRKIVINHMFADDQEIELDFSPIERTENQWTSLKNTINYESTNW